MCSLPKCYKKYKKIKKKKCNQLKEGKKQVNNLTRFLISVLQKRRGGGGGRKISNEEMFHLM